MKSLDERIVTQLDCRGDLTLNALVATFYEGQSTEDWCDMASAQNENLVFTTAPKEFIEAITRLKAAGKIELLQSHPMNEFADGGFPLEYPLAKNPRHKTPHWLPTRAQLT